MSDIKIACPQCQQHIACGPEYSGRTINCPACGTPMAVPNVAPPPTPLLPQSPSVPQAGTCPGCAAALNPGAVICTSCGYNLQTNQRIQPGNVPATKTPAGRTGIGSVRRPVRKKANFFQTSTPYLLLGAAVLAIVFFLVQRESGMIQAFLVVRTIYALTVHILITIHAFSNVGVGTGFLTLCIPFYSIYYVALKSDSDLLKILLGTAVLTGVASTILKNAQ